MTDAAKKRSITYKKPVEVVDGARPMPLGKVIRTLLIAALVAMVLGSHAFQAWANNLPIGPVSDFLLYVVQFWQDLMSWLGLTGVAEGLRTLLHSFEGSH
jgi:hypothetical protein